MAKSPQIKDPKTPYADLTAYAKKRKAGERRQRPTSLFSRFLFTGRRRAIRRVEEEGQGYYVDRFSPADWIPPAALLLVSVADLILTSAWLKAGGTEANPLMAWLAGQGGIWFALVKIAVTLVAAGFFLLHARFRRARLAIGSLIVLYSCLLAYHGYNFGASGVDPASAVAHLAR
jgi:hypothetical protein